MIFLLLEKRGREFSDIHLPLDERRYLHPEMGCLPSGD
jgi:hypothetical protein